MSAPDDPLIPPASWFASGEIASRKLDGYLLSPTHPTGKHKARLWRSVFGICQNDGDLLKSLLRGQLDQAAPVEKPGGKTQRWELVIPRFRGPNNTTAPVLTAWALEDGRSRPHLTTAYPKKV